MKDFIFFRTAEEFQSRPNYQARVDAKLVKLRSIIGKYEFDEKRKLKCGLCGNPHWHGFVIDTEQEIETNIGRDCGEKHFVVEFDRIFAEFRQQEQLQKQRDSIQNFLNDREAIRAQAYQIMPRLQHAFDEIDKIRTDFSREKSLERALDNAVRNNGNIQVQRKESEVFNDALEKVQAKHRLETVGRLQGCAAWGKPKSLISKLKCQVIVRLENIKADALAGKSIKEMSELHAMMVEIKNILQECEQFLEAATQFLDPINLVVLSMLEPVDGRYTSRVNRILERYKDHSLHQRV